MATEAKITKLVDTTTHTRGASVEQIGSQGALVVKLGGADSSSLPGMQVPSSDYIGVAYPDSETEVYTYKTGGSGGTTVATITVVYSDSSKTVLSSIAKT